MGAPDTSSCRRARRVPYPRAQVSLAASLPAVPVMASPRPSPPSRPWSQTPQNPDALHPSQTGSPSPRRPLSAPVRPRQGCLRHRCAGATRPLTRPGRSHELAAIRNREQTESRPEPRHHDRQTRETTTCGTGPVQVSPWCCIYLLRKATPGDQTDRLHNRHTPQSQSGNPVANDNARLDITNSPTPCISGDLDA